MDSVRPRKLEKRITVIIVPRRPELKPWIEPFNILATFGANDHRINVNEKETPSSLIILLKRNIAKRPLVPNGQSGC
ncbi:hypothetical protein PoB_003401300 [Plakobranchus ocellatus]|uniref:Uncharacterized protein n=1 Tax=Plakobranchus ocellatus TaxID=259542 RepID=A0AAV4AJP3_9GAST|nr:hypothetical protein PoB_003401300 [Plakobranchus ocellatus]